MVRKVLFFGLLLLFTNCYYHLTNSGKKRYNLNLSRMKLTKNDSVFQIIDTTKIYELKSVYSLTNNDYFSPFRKSYLKFYGENKVAKFYIFNANDISSIDPIKAEMGYYNYFKGIFITQIYFENAQGAGYIKDKNKVISIDVDLVQFKSKDYIYQYQIIALPKKYLIYKPDW